MVAAKGIAVCQRAGSQQRESCCRVNSSLKYRLEQTGRRDIREFVVKEKKKKEKKELGNDGIVINPLSLQIKKGHASSWSSFRSTFSVAVSHNGVSHPFYHRIREQLDLLSLSICLYFTIELLSLPSPFLFSSLLFSLSLTFNAPSATKETGKSNLHFFTRQPVKITDCFRLFLRRIYYSRPENATYVLSGGKNTILGLYTVYRKTEQLKLDNRVT